MSEKFCLRWNDFEANVSTAFQELRDDKDFFDVTLACEDEQIQAHKVILSACSPFFRTVLKRNPHQHPLLYLKGVQYQELLSILNFMYHGEVNIAQEELNSFLAVAEELKVKGLTQNNTGPKKFLLPKASRQTPDRVEQSRPAKRPRPPLAPAPPVQEQQERPQEEDEVEIQEVMPVKSEPLTQHNEVPYLEEQESEVAGAMVEAEAYTEEYTDFSEYDAGQGYGSTAGLDPTTDNKGETLETTAGVCSEV